MSFILDTNIISELMSDRPNHQVMQWLDEQLFEDLFITSITVAEILFGIKHLEQGKRQNRLSQQAANILDTQFHHRTYDFNKESAIFYAEIRESRTRQGLPISHADCQIAAIACQHNCTLVTRNIKDFQAIDKLLLINPFN